MAECRQIVSDLVRSIAEAPDQVMVTEIEGHPLTFDVRVAQRDYRMVISKISAIKSLAASFAGLPEGRIPVLHVTIPPSPVHR